LRDRPGVLKVAAYDLTCSARSLSVLFVTADDDDTSRASVSHEAAHLRAKVRDGLGLEWGPVVNRSADLAAVS
jgi:hypothetical protein